MSVPERQRPTVEWVDVDVSASRSNTRCKCRGSSVKRQQQASTTTSVNKSLIIVKSQASTQCLLLPPPATCRADYPRPELLSLPSDPPGYHLPTAGSVSLTQALPPVLQFRHVMHLSRAPPPWTSPVGRGPSCDGRDRGGIRDRERRSWMATRMKCLLLRLVRIDDASVLVWYCGLLALRESVCCVRVASMCLLQFCRAAFRVLRSAFCVLRAACDLRPAISYVTSQRRVSANHNPSGDEEKGASTQPAVGLTFTVIFHKLKLASCQTVILYSQAIKPIKSPARHSSSVMDGPIIGPGAVPAFHPDAGPLSAPDLPSGFPRVLNSPLAWYGAQFVDQTEYIHTLDESDLQEAENALQHFKALGLDGDLVSRVTFPLPTLGPRLDRIRRDVHDGKGFAVVRGLDPRKYSVEDLSVLHLGIQSYIANLHGRQDKKGNMMVHIVADASSELKAGHHRHSTSSISFHNEEAGDLISWLTRSTAAAGGKCIIASAYTVYEVLLASRPDMIRTLARSDWPFSMPTFHCKPILYFHEGKLIMNFGGRVMLLGNATHPRPKHLPSLTPRQIEALDAIETIARATELEISTQAGDIHFINNLAILHRREGFTNGEVPQDRRHLVRMRLRDDELGWAIPAELRQEWSATFEQGKTRVWHLEPMPEGFFPLRSQAN
ncbi:hypothetical protein G7046_g7148 [Stylonectria norvegica]|nr:hypothetical protein G7046_g7148 [Stylonectria norvegica]